MKKILIAVAVVTIYLLTYTTIMYMQVNDNVLITMFFISPFLLVGIVYFVLKFGESSGRYTFDERLYDGLDFTRKRKEQMN
ncbi:MAG: hypothetical protein ABIY51_03015 [Ferruginibacter sp.]